MGNPGVFAGTITDAGNAQSIQVNLEGGGGGTLLTITGSNNYRGGTYIAGELQFGDGISTSNDGSINGSINFGSVTANGVITGIGNAVIAFDVAQGASTSFGDTLNDCNCSGGSLIKTGLGTLDLTDTWGVTSDSEDNFFWTTRVEQGELEVESSTALPVDSNLIVDSPASGSTTIVDLEGKSFTGTGVAALQSVTLNNGVIQSSGATATLGVFGLVETGGGADCAISVGLSGPSTLLQSLPGDAGVPSSSDSVILSGADACSGPTVIVAGMLEFTATNPFPPPPQNQPGSMTDIYIESGGALEAGGSYATAGAWLGAQTWLEVYSGQSYSPSYAPLISPSSTGTLAVNGNDNSPSISLAGYNWLSIGAATTNGSIGSATNFTMTPDATGYIFGGGPGTITVDAQLSGNNSVTISGNAVLDPQNNGNNGANSYTGGTVIDAGTLDFEIAAAVPGTGQITINSGGTLEVGGKYTTAGSTQAGPGWIGATTNSGALPLISPSSAGSLALVGNDISTIILYKPSGPGPDYDYTSLSIGAVGSTTFNGSITPAYSAASSPNYYYNFGGGTGALTVDCQLQDQSSPSGVSINGNVNLNNSSNSYTDGTTINAGTLEIASYSDVNSGSIAFGPSGTLQALGALLITGSVTTPAAAAQTATIDTDGNPVTLTGQIGGIGGLTVANSGNSSGTLVLYSTLGEINGNAYLGNTTINANAELEIKFGGAQITGNIDDNGELLFNPQQDESYGTDENNMDGDVISGAGSVHIAAGSYTVTFPGANTYTGQTYVDSGALVVSNAYQYSVNNVSLYVDEALGAGNVTVAGGATLQVQSPDSAPTLLGDTAILSLAGSGVNGTLGALDSNANENEWAGSIQLTSNAQINCDSGSVLTIAGVVAADTVSTNVTLSFGGSGGVEVSNYGIGGNVGITLLGSGSFTLQALSGFTYAGAIAEYASFSVDTDGFAVTLTGQISGSGGLTEISSNNPSSGLLQITGTKNIYTGGTTIDGGMMYFGQSSLPTSGLIVIDSHGCLEASGEYSSAGDWINSGVVSTSSNGTLALVGNDTLTMNLSGNGYNSLWIGAAGIANFGGSIMAGANGYQFGGGWPGTLTVGSLLQNPQQGSNAVTIDGNVVLTDPSNSYTGGTTIDAGTLGIASYTDVARGAIAFGASGTLQARHPFNHRHRFDAHLGCANCDR